MNDLSYQTHDILRGATPTGVANMIDSLNDKLIAAQATVHGYEHSMRLLKHAYIDRCLEDRGINFGDMVRVRFSDGDAICQLSNRGNSRLLLKSLTTKGKPFKHADSYHYLMVDHVHPIKGERQ